MRDYYNDFEPTAAAWLNQLAADNHIPPGVVDDRSILDVAPADVAGFRRCHFFAGIGGWAEALRLAGIPDWLPVWTGSPPCQPFSAAGQRKGRDDERHLGPRFVDLVRAARPPMLFGEQVASADAVGRAAKPGKQGSGAQPAWAWCDDLSLRLEAADYATWAAVVPAAGVGAPHIRQRLFFAAVDLRFADGGMVHGQRTGLEGHGGHGCDRDQPGRDGAQPHGSAWPAGAVGGLARTDRQRRDGFDALLQPWRQGEARVEAAGNGAAGGLANGASQRRDRGEDPAWSRGRDCAENGGSFDRPGPTNGFWSSADWLYCTDGSWRPVEPGSQPLAHGLPARVGRLRGYGNAIVPQAAADFIDASREILIDTGIWQRMEAEYRRAAA